MFCENVKTTNLLIKRDVYCAICACLVEYSDFHLSAGRLVYTYNESRTQHHTESCDHLNLIFMLLATMGT